MGVKLIPVAITGDTVIVVAQNDASETAHFRVCNAKLAKLLRSEGSPKKPSPLYHWLGAEADNGR